MVAVVSPAACAQRIVEKARDEPVGRRIQRPRDKQQRVVFGRAHQRLQQRWDSGGRGHAGQSAIRAVRGRVRTGSRLLRSFGRRI